MRSIGVRTQEKKNENHIRVLADVLRVHGFCALKRVCEEHCFLYDHLTRSATGVLAQVHVTDWGILVRFRFLGITNAHDQQVTQRAARALKSSGVIASIQTPPLLLHE